MTGTIQGGPFGVVLADPPWRFETWSDAGAGRSPQAHYDTMTVEQIKAYWWNMGIDRIVRRDLAVVMWATWPHLAYAFQVLDAWGLRYSTGAPWIKTTKSGAPHRGTKCLLPSASEPFLIAFRGSPTIKANGVRARGLLEAEDPAELNLAIFERRREHSRKPDSIYALCEDLFEGPGLELFARGTPRPGWTFTGNQVGMFGDGL